MSTPFEVLPRDLSAYRRGNTGIDYVHRFDSGRPGPHVLVNALTHGNEFCGMVAACHLLDNAVRPRVGTLTVSFANVAAYESFDPAQPLKSRQIEHNLNRIWSSEWLDGTQDSVELRRARELRPAVAAADHVLDLHSTSSDVQPFWVYRRFDRNAAAARAIGRPRVHLVMPLGLSPGTPLIVHGRFAEHDFHGVSLVAECGGHFRQASADLAVEVTLDFLAHFGLIERERAAQPPPERYELLRTVVIQTAAWRFARPVIGFETFDGDELIALDGDTEIRAPAGGCTILMPTRVPKVGNEGVYLARLLAN